MNFEEFDGASGDGVKNEAEQAEKPEDTPDEFLVKDLIKHANRVGSGDKGIVLKIDHDKLSEGLQNALSIEGGRAAEAQAAKMIKVYAEGVGEYEFGIQKRASNTLENTNGSVDCAKVPEPNMYQSVTLEEGQRENLEKKVEYEKLEDKVEFILMDFVDGDTLFDHLLRKVLQAESNREGNNQASNLSSDRLSGALDEDLRGIAEKIVDFKKLGQAEIAADKSGGQKVQKLDRKNVDNLFVYLRRKGVRIKQTVIDQLENAIDRLHQEGIAHRDLHWGNIMIEGDPFQKDSEEKDDDAKPQVFIIDFGESKEVEPGNVVQQTFEENGRRYLGDKVELERLKQLRTSENDLSEAHHTGVSSPFTRL